MANYLTTGERKIIGIGRKIIGIGREVIGRRKSGEVFPVDLTVCEFWVNGKRYFTGIICDITDRKHLQV